jgi:hypothetical protein
VIRATGSCDVHWINSYRSPADDRDTREARVRPVNDGEVEGTGRSDETAEHDRHALGNAVSLTVLSRSESPNQLFWRARITEGLIKAGLPD